MTGPDRGFGGMFDRVAADYEAGRPSYPATLITVLTELSGRPLAGVRVLDVGAGTGIATRLLRAHGAIPIAVDVGPRLLAALRRANPGTVALVASGDALPLRSAAVDLVVYAQSWHWMDPKVSMREAVRVLRPGGAVAAWWNLPDHAAAPWLVDLEARLAAACPAFEATRHGVPPVADALRAAGLAVATAEVRWRRRLSLDRFLAYLRSHSYVAALPPAAADALMEQERAHLSAIFADEVEEPFRVYLAVGTGV